MDSFTMAATVLQNLLAPESLQKWMFVLSLS